MQRLKTTPFHQRVELLMQGAEWRRWGGYQVASCYEMVPDREYFAVRASAAMFDLSPLAKYSIRGPEAFHFLQKLLTRDISGMEEGQVLYSPWCDHRGKVVDDGTLARLGPEDYQLTAAEQGEAWLQKVAAGFQLEIRNVTDEWGVLAVQGPTSGRILAQLVGDDIYNLKFSQAGHFQAADLPLWISRTGYTGDLGYEIWVSESRGSELWDKLVEVGGAYALIPAGVWALDVARIEAGLIMLEVDYLSALTAESPAQTSSPFELGLGWSVHFKKGEFVGRQALLKEKREKTTPYHFVSCVLDDVAYRRAFEESGLAAQLPVKAWRSVEPLFNGAGEQVGYTTCGTWSPTTQKYIMLCQVHPDWSESGVQLYYDAVVDRHRRRFPCTVVRGPVFQTERKKENYAKV